MISNISIEPFFLPVLQKVFQRRDYHVEISAVPYQEYRENENQQGIEDASIVIIWLNLETLFPQIHDGYMTHALQEQVSQVVLNTCRDLVNYISLLSKAKILWVLFEDFCIHRTIVTGHNGGGFVDCLNRELQKSSFNQTTFIDLKHLIAELGTRGALSSKNKFRWNFPYTKELALSVADEVLRQYFIENGISKKCLVLDCDNVLWGGILSEDGIENIKLGSTGFGREYQEFQRFILSLYYRGTILAICSKNDLVDVLRVFREHGEMILKEEQIACFQVNWENKPDNLRRIAENLNIGLESMVFVDDSLLEVEAMKACLPEITTIRYHREIMYSEFSCFYLKAC